MKGNFHRSLIMITIGHTVSMIAIRFFDMENKRKRKSGKEAIAKRDQRLNPVLSGRSLIWLIISSRWSAIYHHEMNSSDVRRTEPAGVYRISWKNGTLLLSNMRFALLMKILIPVLAYFFFPSFFSLFPSTTFKGFNVSWKANLNLVSVMQILLKYPPIVFKIRAFLIFVFSINDKQLDPSSFNERILY